MVAAMKPSAFRRTAPRRVIALVRVSMDRENLTSPENQRYSIQTYCDRRGDDIVEWIEGIDESGSRKKSAWWAKLDYAVQEVEQGRADAIVVWKFSRTARNRLKWAVALDRVDSAGGSLESATEQTDPTPSGRFQRGVIGEMNAYQAELIGEVWVETHERRRRNGLPPTGGARFGYVINDDKSYSPDPVTGPLLVELYRRYLAGAGFAQLTRLANDAGVRVSAWSYQGLMNVLDSGFAAGLIGRVRHYENGKLKRRSVWEREFDAGVHPPLIDAETWAAYVAARRARTKKPVRTSRKYMLSGIARCGDCGSPMSGKTFDGRPTYICSRSQTTNVVSRVSMVAWRVDQLVEEWLFGLAEDVDAQAAADRRQRVKLRRSQSVVEKLQQQLKEADEMLSALTLKLAAGTLSDDAYRLATTKLEEDRKVLGRRIQLAAPNPMEKSAAEQLSPTLRQQWPLMSVEQRALVLRPLLEAVEIQPAAHRGSVDRDVRIIPRWSSDGR